MGNFYWESISYFLLLSIPLYYQQKHGRNFQGGSELFRTFLTLFGLGGMIVQFTYLGYYAWNISWWSALVVFFLGAIGGGVIGAVIEKLVGAFVLSLAGFVVVPVCAYFMFKTLPA